MTESQAFNRLHTGVQRWVYAQKWSSLRDIQEAAIEPVLNAECDLIISASTAAGKTEAAFLPACSRIVERPQPGFGILYLSPLKALINDQHRRLLSLCEILKLPVTPWHGDVLQSVKNKQRKNPSGILLTTPESLEAMFLNQAGWCSVAFRNLAYIIVDEFHAFLGTERGCQLQSLMHRLEFLIGRSVPRIALSATLSEIQRIARFLRPNEKLPCRVIESTRAHSDLKLQLRGYKIPVQEDSERPPKFEEIVDDLYDILRGRSHLIFANSRTLTEQLAVSLSDRCEENGVPNEFFPHHGNLSKDLRESLESRLQKENLPTSAVCTMTLELGIDIGKVDSIAQVTAPHSVASLRQRLGRSGRRGDPSILRMFIPELEVTAKSHLNDRLRLQTVQCIAMVNLLLKKWYEPPPDKRHHFSTLVQQTLSVVGQHGGVRADQLWSLLCSSGGPFELIDRAMYAQFLKGLGEHDLLSQTSDGQIIVGRKGERIVGHYSFYSAFNTPEEYRLECDGRVIGTLPIDKPLIAGQLVVFAGKRWQVKAINPEKKVITLKRASGGNPPIFGGGGQSVHDIVRQEMLRVYQNREMPLYLNQEAKELLEEAFECFGSLRLCDRQILQLGSTVHLLPWMGDRITNTITMILRMHGLSADCFAGIIDLTTTTAEDLKISVTELLQKPKPNATALAAELPDTLVEKHDYFVNAELRQLGYGTRFFDIEGAWNWLTMASLSGWFSSAIK
jgi:ATP-dependent Lhr-like helicase